MQHICQKMHLIYGYGRNPVRVQQQELFSLQRKNFPMEMSGCVQM